MGLVVFIHVAGHALALEHEPRWHVAGSWQQPQGLAQNSVYCLLQTSDGYLWVGTKAGVCRFDGAHFTTYDDRDGTQLKENEVWALAEGPDGSVWVGTYGGGLTRIKDGRFQTYTTREGLVNDFITTLGTDPSGGLWIGTDDGLSYFKDEKLVSYPVESLPHGRTSVRTFHCAADGTVWIMSNKNELFRWKDGQFSADPLPGLASRMEIRAIATDRDNQLWLGTVNALYRYANGQATRYTTAEGLSASRIRRLYVDAQGTLWVGTNGGIDRFDGTRFRSELLSSSGIAVITGDHEGSLWVGYGSEGFSRLRRGQFRSYSQVDGLKSWYVSATLQDRNGHHWLATMEGLHRFQDGGFVHYPISGPAAANRLASLGQDREGYVWVGTEGGLYRFKSQPAAELAAKGVEFEAMSVPQIPRLFVRVIYEDQAGSLWFGTNLDGLVRYRDGQFTVFTTRDGLGHDAVRGICEDLAGNLWIATKNGGLSCLKDGRFTTYREPDGLASNMAQALYRDSEGAIWISTRHGLSRLKDGRFTTYTAKDGLYSNYVYNFCEDDRGNLWMTCSKGIFRASLQQLRDFADGRVTRIDCVAYGLEHGLSGTTAVVGHHPGAYKAPDGRLWFAMTQGVCVVDTADMRLNKLPPPVHIEEIAIDSERYNLFQSIKAPPGQGDVIFRYTGLSFLAPEKVRFRYRLEGYDSDWIEAGNRREANYNRVPPGSYSFRVLAANNDGVWNDQGAAVAFTIRPFFYQTLWFRGLLGAAFIAVLVLIYRARVRHMRHQAAELLRQNSELERRVDERTAELAKSNETLGASEYFYHSLVESLPQIIARNDADGRFTYVNTAFAELVGRPIAEIIGRTYREVGLSKAAQHAANDERVMTTRQPIEYEELVDRPGEKRRYLHVKKVPLVDAQEKSIGVQLLAWDLTSVRETEEQLKIAQRELIETSRLAGIAEVATGVLHNIGNALNSVNVSASVATDRLRTSKISNVDRLARLLPADNQQLEKFYSSDSRALLLPRYLSELSTVLQAENQEICRELEALRTGVDHIKEIVAAQQDFARVSAVTEQISVPELTEYALHLSQASLSRHQIDIVREFENVPTIVAPRQKALQILVNLIRNAKESIDEAGGTDRRMRIAIRLTAAGRLRVEVQDYGIGISQENLTRIFAFGFTTKKSGHGFGLHSSVLAAQEMGGALTVESEGLGCGATFILELPCSPTTPASVATEEPAVATASAS